MGSTAQTVRSTPLDELSSSSVSCTPTRRHRTTIKWRKLSWQKRRSDLLRSLGDGIARGQSIYSNEMNWRDQPHSSDVVRLHNWMDFHGGVISKTSQGKATRVLELKIEVDAIQSQCCKRWNRGRIKPRDKPPTWLSHKKFYC